MQMSLYEFVDLSPVAFTAWKAYNGSGPGQIRLHALRHLRRDLPPLFVSSQTASKPGTLAHLTSFSISDEICESADPPWSGAGGRPKLRMREAPIESCCYEPTPTDFEIDCFLESWYKKNQDAESWLDEDQERDLIRTAISTFGQVPSRKPPHSATSTP